MKVKKKNKKVRWFYCVAWFVGKGIIPDMKFRIFYTKKQAIDFIKKIPKESLFKPTGRLSDLDKKYGFRISRRKFTPIIMSRDCGKIDRRFIPKNIRRKDI